MQTRNNVLKQYFADILDVPISTYNINTTIKLALEKLGYSGGMNKMLLAYWTDQGGTGSGLNTVFRTALIAMGGTGNSINTLINALDDTGLTWDSWNVDIDKEDRTWENIG